MQASRMSRGREIALTATCVAVFLGSASLLHHL